MCLSIRPSEVSDTERFRGDLSLTLSMGNEEVTIKSVFSKTSITCLSIAHVHNIITWLRSFKIEAKNSS